MEISRKSIQDIVDFSSEEFPDTSTLISLAQELLVQNPDQKTIHSFLDLGHLSNVNSAIVGESLITDWLDLLMKLISKSNYSFGHLFYQRANRYKDKILFRHFKNSRWMTHSYYHIWKKVLKIAGALTYLEYEAENSIRIGILTPNSLSGALVDLACLSFHFTNVPIPANAADRDIEFILKHSGITHLFIGGKKQSHWKTILNSRLEGVKIIEFESESWELFISKSIKVDPLKVLRRINKVRLTKIATIMYTSGTTGEPKGITFTQYNMIVKRFARALSLPEIGHHDSFLSYLPLYHTFGRYLELQGSIFWGGSYTFAQDSSFDTLRKNFIAVKPTIFISVPRRWMQLYETIQSILSSYPNNEKLVNKALKKVTGGNLKWGLSAAGYLDPDIFQFFQINNVHLLSGYGMTEATGGISLTPPDEYVVDSVGKALPGIDLHISEDGELLLKGPYISEYYFGAPPVSTFIDGWFHTGDIFTEKNGHYFIKDRKKEIYKNAAGQTITPQKIENMLQEFDAIESAFLIGDHLNYNTVLIYPNPEYIKYHFPDKDTDNIRISIGALIQSVNGFLSRYEQIVNFAIIPRNFSVDYDELTPKESYKRKNILKNWANIIEPMYSRNQINLDIKGKRISFPNWLMKNLNIVPEDIEWTGQYLKIKSLNRKCKCSWRENHFLLGDFTYEINSSHLDIKDILLDPRLWLGNQPFVELVGNIPFQLIHLKRSNHIMIVERKSTLSLEMASHHTKKPSLKSLHKGLWLLGQEDMSGFQIIEPIIKEGKIKLIKLVIDTLKYMIDYTNLKFSQTIFDFLIPFLTGAEFLEVLNKLFNKNQNTNGLITNHINIHQLTESHIEATIHNLLSLREKGEITLNSISYIIMLFEICSSCVKKHPKYYSYIRHELTHWLLHSSNKNLIQSSKINLKKLSQNLKPMYAGYKMGIHQWNQLIQFENTISSSDQDFILNIFNHHSMINEAIFIYSGGRYINFKEIENDSIWISQLTKGKDCNQYRILLTLNEGSAFNFIISHFPSLNKSELTRLNEWQVSLSSGIDHKNLVNNFISGWPDQKIIISEYDHGSDVYSYLASQQNEIENTRLKDRWDMRWYHFGWSSLQAYIKYITQTHFTYALADVSIHHVIVSEFDNATHVRIKQSFKTEKITSLLKTLVKLYEEVIIFTEQQFPGLNHVLDFEVIFTCILQSTGTTYGLSILNKIQHEFESKEVYGFNSSRMEAYIKKIESYGFLPKPLIFASLRFQRWLDLNQKATIQAQSEILQELFTDYKMHELYQSHPSIRIQYFLATIFRDRRSFISKELLKLSTGITRLELTDEKIESRIYALIKHPNCTENDAYFLTRMIYHHVESSDYTELIPYISDEKNFDLIIKIHNKNRERFTIRQPYKPKELALFHDLLLSYNLYANFTDDHKFLLLFSNDNKLCGGIYWKFIDQNLAHLEKIAIQEKYQESGLGERLLKECLYRINNRKVKYVTVPFMKSEFFKHHGFKTDTHFSGLVKEL